MKLFKDERSSHLILGLLFDAIGMTSYFIPGIGAFTDIIWAPVAGWLMARMYKGKLGKAAGVITFLEEILPGLDIIPSFTIMWLYTYIYKGRTRKSLKMGDSPS